MWIDFMLKCGLISCGLISCSPFRHQWQQKASVLHQWAVPASTQPGTHTPGGVWPLPLRPHPVDLDDCDPNRRFGRCRPMTGSNHQVVWNNKKKLIFNQHSQWKHVFSLLKHVLTYAFVTQQPFRIPYRNLDTCIFVASTKGIFHHTVVSVIVLAVLRQ